MMQIIALQTPSGEILVSRAQWDYVKSKDGLSYIDSGQEYPRYEGGKLIRIELDVNLGELYNDWNRRIDKFCSFENVKIIPENEWEDRTTFEWKKKELCWGSNGKSGKEPTTYRRLIELETDHLENILLLSHISDEYRKIIESILEDRK